MPNQTTEEQLDELLIGFAQECIEETFEKNRLDKKLTGTEPKRIKFSEAKSQLLSMLTDAEQNAVAWTIMVIDEIHMNDVGTGIDRAYKGVKNKLRDRYKSITGIDPAPHYPIKAQLSAQQPQVAKNEGGVMGNKQRQFHTLVKDSDQSETGIIGIRIRCLKHGDTLTITAGELKAYGVPDFQYTSKNEASSEPLEKQPQGGDGE